MTQLFRGIPWNHHIPNFDDTNSQKFRGILYNFMQTLVSLKWVILKLNIISWNSLNVSFPNFDDHSIQF